MFYGLFKSYFDTINRHTIHLISKILHLITTLFFTFLVPMCGIEEDVIAMYEISSLNSYISNNWLFKVGSEITMSCKSGYRTSEENVKLVCKAENNGNWSRNPPECEGDHY